MKTMGHKIQTRIISGLLVFVMVFASIVSAGLVINGDLGDLFKALGFGEGSSVTDLALTTTTSAPDFITAKGNWGYELTKINANTMKLDGIKEDAYTTAGFTLPGNIREPAEGNGYNVSFVADNAYLYIFYEVERSVALVYDKVAAKDKFRSDGIDLCLDLTGTESRGNEFRIFAQNAGYGKPSGDQVQAIAGDFFDYGIENWCVTHTGLGGYGWNMELIVPLNKLETADNGDKTVCFTSIVNFPTNAEATGATYTVAAKATNAESKDSPTTIVIKDGAVDSFVTPAGNYGYNITESATALNVDGKRDEAYNKTGLWLPTVAVDKNQVSHKSTSDFDLYIAADKENVYFLYEFTKAEAIHPNPDLSNASLYKFDCVNFTYNLAANEISSDDNKTYTEMRVGPSRSTAGGSIDKLVYDNYKLGENALYVNGNNYNIEFAIPRDAITGTYGDSGNQAMTFTAICTIGWGENNATAVERYNTWGYAKTQNKNNPSTIVITKAPENLAEPEMDEYSDVDFATNGRWGYFLNESEGDFTLDGYIDQQYKSGVKIAQGSNRVTGGFTGEVLKNNYYDLYVGADKDSVSILWEFTDDNIVTNGHNLNSDGTPNKATYYNYYNDAAQFVLTKDGRADGGGGSVIDFGPSGARTGTMSEDGIPVRYAVVKTDKGFNVEIKFARGYIFDGDTFGFMGLSSIAADANRRTYGFMSNPYGNSDDVNKNNVSLFHIVDKTAIADSAHTVADGRYVYTVEKTNDVLLNDGYLDPAYLSGVVLNNKYNSDGNAHAENTYTAYVAADDKTVGIFFEVTDNHIVTTSPSYWHDDCVHFKFSKDATLSGGEDTHLLVKGGQRTEAKTINGVSFTYTVVLTEKGYNIEATFPRSQINDAFSMMPRLSLASAPGVNTYGYVDSAASAASDASLSKMNLFKIVDGPETVNSSVIYTEFSAATEATNPGYTDATIFKAMLANPTKVAIVYPKEAAEGLLNLIRVPTAGGTRPAYRPNGKDYVDRYGNTVFTQSFKDELAATVLSGTSGINGAAVLQEGSASIANYTYKILVGHVTSYTETQKMIDTIGYDKYGVGVFGNTVSIMGATEQMLAKAIETFKAACKDATPSTLYYGTSPAVAGARLPYVSGTRIVSDVGYGTYVIVKNGVTEANFIAYCDELLAAGFRPVSYNNMDGKYRSMSFYDDTTIVTVGYGLHYAKHITVNTDGIDNRDAYMSQTEQSLRISVSSRAVATLNAAPEEYEKVTDTVFSHATQDWDLCEIIRLENGEFIIFDSAHYGDAEFILRELYGLTGGEKPVVAAWFITHFHQDHMGGIVALGDKYSDRITVKNVVLNIGSEQVINTCFQYVSSTPSTGDYMNIVGLLPALGKLGAKVTVSATGQSYNFANATVDILHTYSDLMPYTIAADSTNRTSTIYAVSLASKGTKQKIIITGDGERDGHNLANVRYGSYLKADFLQVAHHGSSDSDGADGKVTAFYTAVDPSFILVPRAYEYDTQANFKAFLKNANGNAIATPASKYDASTTAIVKTVLAKYKYTWNDLFNSKVDNVIIEARRHKNTTSLQTTRNGSATGYTSAYTPQIRRLNIPYTAGSVPSFPHAGSAHAAVLPNSGTGVKDSDANLAPNIEAETTITKPIGSIGDGGSYLYVANTVYKDIETDGDFDEAYTYGIHLKNNWTDNAAQYHDVNFDVYLVAGQDGKIHVYYQVIDEHWHVYTNTETDPWDYKYRMDGIDFYYGFGAPGYATSDFRIKAVNGAQSDYYTDGKLSSVLKNDYVVKVTNMNGGTPVRGEKVKYVVEFSIDNNGKPFENGDLFTFTPLVNSISQWTSKTEHKNVNSMVDTVLSAAKGGYPASFNTTMTGHHNVLVFSTAPATNYVTETNTITPAKNSDNNVGAPAEEVVLDKEIVGAMDDGNAAPQLNATAVYSMGTAYTTPTIDGDLDNIYKYGHKVSAKYGGNREKADFDAYLIYTQDGKINVFVEVIDKTMTAKNGAKIGYGFQDGNMAYTYRRDSVHFYYRYGGMQDAGGNRSLWIGAVAGNTQVANAVGGEGVPTLPSNYYVKMTDNGYNVEFVIDHDFKVGDTLKFGVYLNDAQSELKTAGTYNSNAKDSITHGSYYIDTITKAYMNPNDGPFGFDAIKISTTDSVTKGKMSTPDSCNHSLADGETCNKCGMTKMQLGTSVTGSLALEEIIKLVVSYSPVDGAEKYADKADRFGVLIWNTSSMSIEDAVYENAEVITTNSSYDVDTGKIKTLTEGIPVAKLSDVICLRPFYKNDDGTYSYGRFVTGYSLKKYCETRISKTTNANEKALMISILNYGTAAQMYFNYNEANPMNVSLTEEQKVLTWDGSLVNGKDYTVPAAKEGLISRDTTNITSRGGTLFLEGAIDINFYCRLNAGITPTSAKIYYWTEEDYNSLDVLTLSNASSCEDMVWNPNASNGGRWDGTYEGNPAAYMFKLVYACMVFEDASGNQYCSGVLGYSAGRFAYNSQNNSNVELANLAKWTAVYGDAARTYFGVE